MNTFLAPLVDRRTYRNLLYLALGLPLGTFYFTFISTATSLGVSLLIIWVGIPILAATVIAWRALARFERRLTERLLGTPIPSPSSPVVDGMNRWERSRVTLADIHTWRYLAWLLLRFPLGIFGFVLAVVATTVPLSLIVSPVALLFPDEWIEPSWLNSVDWLVWVVPVFGVGLAAAFAWAVNAFGELNAVWAKALLGPSPRHEQIVLRRRAEVAEERIRLAHELHDSVGHTLTMNVVQAGAGGHAFERDPEFARQALQNIETSGRRALGDLDRILGLLREDGDGVERAPQPGLEGIAALVADVGELGVPIELHVTGPTDEVPAVVGRSAYRIVQEALTNVVRHAGRTSTRVAVQHGVGALELEIVNDRPEAGLGHGIAPAAGGGRGLAGIRERVGLLGGTVDTGPRPDGGFRVWASLPLSGSGS